MADRDPMAEAQRLAETLRQSLATLDEQIERRSREFAVDDDLLRFAQRRGRSMRSSLIAQAPEEAYDFLVSLPAETWTSSAALLLSEIYAEIAKREADESERKRG